MKKALTNLVVLTVVLAIAVSGANAVTITNTTTSTVLGSDDFESASVVDHLAYTANPTDADPDNPSAGTWSVTEGNTGLVQVTDYGTPGAFEGDNYLRIHRTTESGAPDAELRVAEQATTNDAIHFEAMINHPVNNISGALVLLYGNDSNSVEQILVTLYFKSDGKIHSYNGSSWDNTNISYTANAWEELEMDWLVGADTFSLTYDGTTASNLAVRNTNVGSFTSVFFTNGISTFYLDAIPEPATISLLVLGGIGILVRRRRRS